MNEERKQILQMVESGKITVEEALKLMEAMEKTKQDPEPNNGSGANQTKQEPETSFEPSTFVNYDSNYSSASGEQKGYKRHSFIDKFTDFIDSALQKIKDVDLDFNFGTPVEVNHIFQHKDVYLSNINLDISNGNIKIIPWEERDVRIECNAKVYKSDSFDDAKTYFLKSVRFSIDGESMKFSVEPKQIKMSTVLYIPKAVYNEIQIRMFNGHVAGERLQANKLKVNTANGNIDFSHLQGQDFEFETANGHIKVVDSFSQEIEAETINGTINVHGAFEKVDLQSFSSNIICKLQDSKSKIVYLNTKTGSIDLFLPTDLEVKGKIKSNIGGFKCELTDLEILDEKKDVIQKELNFIANSGKTDKLYVEASSNAGSILVKNL
ncbi:DUF4097 domain-containing protein [Schinkia azotoformans]|uniref:DUF4097 family beta strand repeat-containing protein n=1 Tax=Schinkia azotoformans TaxID=1454 RepID=UPI002E1E73FD|nr:DUF4097 domain-containing protein [Schinkia azotoformans]